MHAKSSVRHFLALGFLKLAFFLLAVSCAGAPRSGDERRLSAVMARAAAAKEAAIDVRAYVYFPDEWMQAGLDFEAARVEDRTTRRALNRAGALFVAATELYELIAKNSAPLFALDLENAVNNQGTAYFPDDGDTAEVLPVPGDGFAEQLAWFRINAESNAHYVIEINGNAAIAPQRLTLPPLRGNVTVTFRGTGAPRVISLSANGSLFTVGSGVTLVLDGNVTLQGRNRNSNSLVRINNGGALVMNPGTNITGNTETGFENTWGGGVAVHSGGTFTMHGGEISRNSANWGGGVYTRGNFVMNGGTISGNTARANGGGVNVAGTVATFDMLNGTISGNSGGGVYNVGTFVMHDGTISNNVGSSGDTGGVGRNGGIGTHGRRGTNGSFGINGGGLWTWEGRGGTGGDGGHGGSGGHGSGGMSGGSGSIGGSGGVFNAGVFTMYGGTISGNSGGTGGAGGRGGHGGRGGDGGLGGRGGPGGHGAAGRTANANGGHGGGGGSGGDGGHAGNGGRGGNGGSGGDGGSGGVFNTGAFTMHGGVIHGNSGGAGGRGGSGGNGGSGGTRGVGGAGGSGGNGGNGGAEARDGRDGRSGRTGRSGMFGTRGAPGHAGNLGRTGSGGVHNEGTFRISNGVIFGSHAAAGLGNTGGALLSFGGIAQRGTLDADGTFTPLAGLISSLQTMDVENGVLR